MMPALLLGEKKIHPTPMGAWHWFFVAAGCCNKNGPATSSVIKSRISIQDVKDFFHPWGGAIFWGLLHFGCPQSGCFTTGPCSSLESDSCFTSALQGCTPQKPTQKTATPNRSQRFSLAIITGLVPKMAPHLGFVTSNPWEFTSFCGCSFGLISSPW